MRNKIRFALSGPDSRRYLNGQVTADISRLEPGTARQALLLTAKGKLCAPLQVWAEGDSLVVETEEDLRDETAARLERYLISDDVTIAELPHCPPAFHVFGVNPPQEALRIQRLGTPGFDLPALPEGVLVAEESEIEILRIERGIPRWGRELTPDTLPQEARLELSSVDFQKGCYVGQEVVSRLRSVGHVNRLLYRFSGRLSGAAALPVYLLLKDDPGSQAGTITSAAYDFELAQTLALGYLNRQFDGATHFLAADAAGAVIGELEKHPI